jgi:hypothetical protein
MGTEEEHARLEAERQAALDAVLDSDAANMLIARGKQAGGPAPVLTFNLRFDRCRWRAGLRSRIGIIRFDLPEQTSAQACRAGIPGREPELGEIGQRKPRNTKVFDVGGTGLKSVSPPSYTCRLLARDHAAPEPTLLLTKAV